MQMEAQALSTSLGNFCFKREVQIFFLLVSCRGFAVSPEVQKHFQIFQWSRKAQEFSIDDSRTQATTVFIRAWGGAGAGGDGYSGGAGGYVSGMVELPPGSKLKIVVGKGGVEKGENGEPSGVYLNEIRQENLLLSAGGGGASSKSERGNGGGREGLTTSSFADSLLLKNRFFLQGEDGSPNADAKPEYTCTRSYIEGSAEGHLNAPGGNGLVAISRGTQDFCYTGADQIFSVPGGVSSLTVKAWGAGGGGSIGTNRSPGSGGGYATRTFPINPGDVVAVIVGGGGRAPYYARRTVYGGGGTAHFTTYNNWTGAGSGGGRSAVRVYNVIAGGGGGAGSSSTSGSPHAISGVGGGAAGGDGGDAPNATSGGDGGAGGTQSAGGAPGYYQGDGTSYPGGFGSIYTGGTGGSGNLCYGGGGGGGFYGGGGGGGGEHGGTSNPGGGGGGGSSFPSTGSLSGSGQSSGNATDSVKPKGAGYGGDPAKTGGAGFVYFSW